MTTEKQEKKERKSHLKADIFKENFKESKVSPEELDCRHFLPDRSWVKHRWLGESSFWKKIEKNSKSQVWGGD